MSTVACIYDCAWARQETRRGWGEKKRIFPPLWIMAYGIFGRDSEEGREELGRGARMDKRVVTDCALQLKNLNRLKNTGKPLRAFLHDSNNLFINCSWFVLATTCFTHCRKIFKKFVFFASPKTRVVTVHPPYKNLVPEIKVLLGRWRGRVLLLDRGSCSIEPCKRNCRPFVFFDNSIQICTGCLRISRGFV